MEEQKTPTAAPVDAAVHTPGPWKAERLVSSDGIPYSTMYEAHIDVGACMVWCPPGNREQEANARLIAAAPELLAACRELIAAMDEYEMTADGPPTPEHREMMLWAMAAVEKATISVG